MRAYGSQALAFAVLAAACGGKPATSDGGAHFQRDWAAHPALVTLTGAGEIDVVGDLHGDADVAYRVLIGAGLITPTSPPAWTGGTKVLVVPGDIIDKGSSALPIIDLFMALEPEARAAGGRVVVTLGNHEAEFLANPDDAKTAVFQAELRGAGVDARAVAAGTSRYGEWLHDLPVAALIDDWFFCHSGDSDGLGAVAIGSRFRDALEGASGYGDDSLVGMGSILEANAWWLNGAAPGAAAVDANLAALPASHVVFGHDPGALDFPGDSLGARAKGELAARYDGRLFLVDVGMSYAVGFSVGALLRITSGPSPSTATVRSDGSTTALWP